MSWSAEGRLYHDYAEYQRALARQTDQRLRRAVERLRIPAADTSRLEAEVAAAEVRQQAVRRLASQLERETSERRDLAAAHRERIGDAFREVEQQEGRLVADLEAFRAESSRHLAELERLRETQTAAVAADLERELQSDRDEAGAARRRREDLLARTGTVLAGLPAERLRQLGLDAAPVQDLLSRAREEGEIAGLDLARRAYDQARGLASNADYREARLSALREEYAAEVEDLRQALQWSAEDRADLVGEGGAALDAPLRQELDRLHERVEGIRYYEDHELRFSDTARVLDLLTARVSDLASQVRDFDQLEENRLDLVRHRLGGKLKEVLGEEVQLLEVVAGELGLQPVEARFRTARGEKVDCSVALDGTLRIHHYDHVDEASCAQSARAMAEHLPELMALQGQPALDVATEAAERSQTAAGQAATRPTEERVS